MLGTRGDRVAGSKVVTLETPDHGYRHGRCEEGIFAGAFRDPAPARVTGHVHHRRKRPVDTVRGRFGGRDARTLFHEFRVPGRCLGQGNGQNGLETVDDVPADKERYTEPAFLHGNALQFIDSVNVGEVQDRAKPAGPQVVAQVIRRMSVTGVRLAHLADLLFGGHLRQQLIHALFH